MSSILSRELSVMFRILCSKHHLIRQLIPRSSSLQRTSKQVNKSVYLFDASGAPWLTPSGLKWPPMDVQPWVMSANSWIWIPWRCTWSEFSFPACFTGNPDTLTNTSMCWKGCKKSQFFREWLAKIRFWIVTNKLLISSHTQAFILVFFLIRDLPSHILLLQGLNLLIVFADNAGSGGREIQVNKKQKDKRTL